MTRIDFYILEKAGSDPLKVACRLAEKAYRENLTVYVNANSPAQSIQLDRLMWVFRDDSFVPHVCIGDETKTEFEDPVAIGCGKPPESHLGLLINLREEIPDVCRRFERIAELVDNNDKARLAGRERFRIYRDQGFSLNTHRI